MKKRAPRGDERREPERKPRPPQKPQAPQKAKPQGKPRAGEPAGKASSARKGPPERGGGSARKGPPERGGASARKGPPDRDAASARKGPPDRGAASARKAPPARKPRPSAAPQGPSRSGAVALIGRANVGKSTLLNAALGAPLAITSPTPQTTRDTLLGVLHRGSAELRLLDTPGLHKPKTELGRVMNHFAREAARAADVVVFVTDVPRPRAKDAPLAPHPGDLTLLQSFKEGAAESGAPGRPVVLALNKVDTIRDKKALLPLIEAFSKVLPFEAIVPLSALREGDAERVIDVVAGLCPEGPWQFGPDDLTDRPTRYFAAEYVREQILRATRLEVPHAAAVTIDRFSEPERGAVEIDVTIHVERPGQKKILVGRGGETMKRIGSNARRRVEELLGRKVILKTWVRVTPAWRASAERLSELGYQKRPREEGVMIFADLDDDALAPPDEALAPPGDDPEDEEQEQ